MNLTRTFPIHLTLILLFLAVLFVEAPLNLALDLAGGSRPRIGDLVTQAPSMENLRRLETDLEEESRLVRSLRPPMQALSFHLFGDLGRKSVRGVDGWWFYDLDVRYLTERWRDDDSVLRAVVGFRDQLSERGIRLLLVPAPGKPTIHPEKLTRRAEGVEGLINPDTLRLLDRLRGEGVEVVDLFAAFRSHLRDATAEPLYLQQDTHWAPAGMQRAARETARRLLELGWTERGATVYALEEKPISRYGDVLRMSQLPAVEKHFQPEEILALQVRNAADGSLYADDPRSDILVLGDSFLRIYERDEPESAGFVAHLAHELGKPIASIINDGGASTLVRQELYRKPELLADKKVVIWEFVERDIRFGTEGWQNIPLPEFAQETTIR